MVLVSDDFRHLTSCMSVPFAQPVVGSNTSLTLNLHKWQTRFHSSCLLVCTIRGSPIRIVSVLHLLWHCIANAAVVNFMSVFVLVSLSFSLWHRIKLKSQRLVSALNSTWNSSFVNFMYGHLIKTCAGNNKRTSNEITLIMKQNASDLTINAYGFSQSVWRN